MASAGSLIFDTKIDLSGIEKGLADIRNAVLTVTENTDRLSTIFSEVSASVETFTSSTVSLSSTFSEVSTSVQTTTSTIENLNSTCVTSSSSVKNVTNTVDIFRSACSNVGASVNATSENISKLSSTFSEVSNSAKVVTNHANLLSSSCSKVSASTKTATSNTKELSSSFSNASSSVQTAKKSTIDFSGSVEKIKSGTEAISAIGDSVSNMNQLWQEGSEDVKKHAKAFSETKDISSLFQASMSSMQLVMGTLSGGIEIVTAAQTLWNIAMSANPIGAVIMAVAALTAGIAILASNMDTTTEAEDSLQRSHDKMKDTMNDVGQYMDEHNNRINNTKSLYDGLNENIGVSAEKQETLAKDMEDTQDKITGIAMAASDGRRDFTKDEINELNNLFKKMDEIAQKQLEITKSKQDFDLDYAESIASDTSINAEEYQAEADRIVKTAEETKNAVIDQAREQMQTALELKRQTMIAEGNYSQEAFNNERIAQQAQYDQTVLAAENTYNKTLEVVSQGYLQRNNVVKQYLQDSCVAHEEETAEMERYNQQKKKIEEDSGKDYKNVLDDIDWTNSGYKTKAEALEKEHTEKMAKIRGKATGNLDEEGKKQLAFYLLMTSKMDLCNGQISASTLDMASSVIGNVRTMGIDLGENTKKAFDPLAKNVDEVMVGVKSGTVKAFEGAGKPMGSILSTEMNTATMIAGTGMRIQNGSSGVACDAMGKPIPQGIADGTLWGQFLVNGAIRNLLKVMVQEGKITINSNSPSKLTRDVLGKPISQGIAVGITADAPKAVNAMVDAVASTVTAGKDAVSRSNVKDTGSQIMQNIATGIRESAPNTEIAMVDAIEGIINPDKIKTAGNSVAEAIASGITEDDQKILNSMNKVLGESTDKFNKAESQKVAFGKVGKGVVDGIAVGIKANAEKNLDEFDKLLKNLERRRSLGMIEDKEYYQELGELRDDHLNKGSEKWWEYTEKIAGYNQGLFKTQLNLVEEQKKNIEKTFEDLVISATKNLEKVQGLIDKMTSKLQNYAKPFDKGSLKLKNGDTYETLLLNDYKQELWDLNRYDENLKAIKERGVPEEIIEKLVEMSTEDAMQFAEKLATASDEEYKNFVEGYTAYMAKSKEVSNNHYADKKKDAEDRLKVAESLKNEVDEALKNVPEDFKKNGKLCADNFADGFIDKIKGACERIKAAISAETAKIGSTLPAQFMFNGAGGGNTTNNNYSSHVSFDGSKMSIAEQRRIAYDQSIMNRMRYAV